MSFHRPQGAFQQSFSIIIRYNNANPLHFITYLIPRVISHSKFNEKGRLLWVATYFRHLIQAPIG
ncbi:MAG: hypothetical protein ACOCNA_03735, partial [Prevotella pectinovora]